MKTAAATATVIFSKCFAQRFFKSAAIVKTPLASAVRDLEVAPPGRAMTFSPWTPPPALPPAPVPRPAPWRPAPHWGPWPPES